LHFVCLWSCLQRILNTDAGRRTQREKSLGNHERLTLNDCENLGKSSLVR
jgi:hypothetical protein